GLDVVAKDSSKAFYKEETLGKVKYFTAIYADKAVSPACVGCHNDHKDSPKTDFKLGQTMGGVVIRLPMK
ncbi:MAG: c-type heme family protein, partial [Burkholderiales bacterium]